MWSEGEWTGGKTDDNSSDGKGMTDRRAGPLLSASVNCGMKRQALTWEEHLGLTGREGLVVTVGCRTRTRTRDPQPKEVSNAVHHLL